MARTDRLKLEGQTHLRATRNGVSRPIDNAIRLFVDPGKARIEIDGLPISDLPPSFWEWDNASVVRALRWIAEELEKRAYAARPIDSFFKPEKPDPKPTDEVRCPCCAGEAWPSCPLCDGAGRTIRREAERWRRGS
jgi:hypothetical protein